MMRRLVILAIVVAGLATPAAFGQLKVGDKAPSIKAKELLNTKIKSLDELKGRVILLEYFAHW